MATSKGTSASVASGSTGSIGVRQTLQRRALKLKISEKNMSVDAPEAEESTFGLTSAMISSVNVPAAAPSQSHAYSPELKRQREAIEELFTRDRGPQLTLPVPPPLPGANAGGDMQTVLLELVNSVNDMRSSLANVASRSDLQELHTMQMEEVKTYVAQQLVPIEQAMITLEAVHQAIAASVHPVSGPAC